ncbi:MAG: quinate 5-dehydrogenase [Actinomycetota bacterium]|nr:quinate 5-dehydrogenase [Actinomycetota bacterium]
MKRIVSVSLGSSKRNHKATESFLGEEFTIERVGTDGDFKKAIKSLKELDGKVDAIGLGGIDLYLFAGNKRYVKRDAKRFKDSAKITPVVDGSGLKDTLERETVRYLIDEAKLSLKGKKVLMTSAVDRFGMAEALHEAGCEMRFGDLIFGLGIPIMMRSIKTFRFVASLLLPIVVWIPHRLLYPTGSAQEKEPKEKYAKHYQDADIIAGDYIFIRKFMPKNMGGKWVLTNTITESDIEDLKERGVELLITTTPEFEGRSFGTNVMEATMIAILGKKVEEVKPADYSGLLKELDFKPRIIDFSKDGR